MINKINGLYLILSDPVVGYEKATQAAVDAYVPFIQLRMKNASPESIIKKAREIKKITYQSQTSLVINDYIKVAIEVDADAIHVGQNDTSIKEIKNMWNMPNKLIGISTHNLKQARIAEANGADYIGVGPIYNTDSKSNIDPLIGIKEGNRIASSVKCKTVAIGGINTTNLKDFRNTNFNAFCVLGAVNNSNQPKQVIKKLQEEWEDVKV